MGMLTGAFLQGAGQGLNILGQGMQRDLDRQDEQSMWERRTRLLGEIQRENATVQREDQAAFEDKRFPTRMKQESELVASRNDAQRAADKARLGDTELTSLEESRDQRKAATQTENEMARLRAIATDETLKKSDRQKAADKLKDFEAETEVRTRAAIRVNDAHERAKSGAGAYDRRGGGGDGEKTVKLPPAVDRAFKQLAATENDLVKAITKSKSEAGGWDPKANPGQQDLLNELADTRRAQQRLLQPYMPQGQGQGAMESDDPYRVKPPDKGAAAAKKDDVRKDKPKPDVVGDTKPDIRSKITGMLGSLSGGTGRSQSGAITEDSPRRGYPGGFIFNGKTYPTLEAAKAARGY